MDDVVFIWSHILEDRSTGVSGNCEFVFLNLHGTIPI
jgi:hypothetical protein